MKRRPCRAAACPRKVPRGTLFCAVHLPQLTPAERDPLNGNQELPGAADPNARRALVGGIAAAVAALAKKEGRSEALRQAINSQNIDPIDDVTGTTDDNAGSPFGRDTYKRPDLR